MMLMLLSGVACGAPRALPAVLLDAGSGQSSGGDGVPPAAPPAARRAPQGPVRSRVRDAEGGAGTLCSRSPYTSAASPSWATTLRTTLTFTSHTSAALTCGSTARAPAEPSSCRCR